MAPKVTVVSDLHLEARPLQLDEILDPDLKSDVLCLLGDIGDPASQPYRDLLAAASARFPTVLLLAGNNEYRNHDGGCRTMDQTEAVIREATAPYPNVRFLQNETHVVDGVAFIGTTLWSYLPDDPLPGQEDDGDVTAATAPTAVAAAAAAVAVVPDNQSSSAMVPEPGATPPAPMASLPAAAEAAAIAAALASAQAVDANSDIQDPVVMVHVTRPAAAASNADARGSKPIESPFQTAADKGLDVERISSDTAVGREASASETSHSAGAAALLPPRPPSGLSGFAFASNVSTASAASNRSSSGGGGGVPPVPLAAAVPVPAAATAAIPVSSPSRRLNGRAQPPLIRGAARSQPVSSPLHLLRWRNCAAYGVGGDNGSPVTDGLCGADGAAGGIDQRICRRLMLRHSISLSSLRPDDPIPAWNVPLAVKANGSSSGSSVSDSGSESDASSVASEGSNIASDEGEGGFASGSATTASNDSVARRRRRLRGRRVGDELASGTSPWTSSSDTGVGESATALVLSAQLPTSPPALRLSSEGPLGVAPGSSTPVAAVMSAIKATTVDPLELAAAAAAPAATPSSTTHAPAPPATSSARSEVTSRRTAVVIPEAPSSAAAAATAANAASSEAPPAAVRSHSHHGHHHHHHHSRNSSSSAAVEVPPATIREYIGASSLDYRRIYASPGGPPITTDVTNALFTASLEYIQVAVAAARARGLVPVVLTHHAPSLRGTSRPKFAGHPSTHAYGTDLEPYLEDSGIAVWYCGHTHYNFDMTLKGGVRLASNQFGSQPQPGEGYNRSWQHKLPSSAPERSLSGYSAKAVPFSLSTPVRRSVEVPAGPKAEEVEERRGAVAAVSVA